MFNVFCLSVALSVGQGPPAEPFPTGTAGRALIGEVTPSPLPRMTLPSAPMPIPGRVPYLTVAQNKDGTPTPMPPAKEAPKDAATGDKCNACEEKKEEEKKPEEKGHFMKLLDGTCTGKWMEDNRLSISGFSEGSYTATNHRSANTPILFQNPTDRFLFNQNWLTVERTVDTEAKVPTWGFRVDAIVPGSDARFVRQKYLFDDQTGRNQLDIYQFYAQFLFPDIAKGLDVKIGRMAVPYMAEVTPATGNALFSHSYAYYYNPFTHTGIWATLKLSDNWSVGAIASTGNDVWFGSAANGMFVGILQWTSSDSNDTALLCVGLSNSQFNVRENFSQQSHVDVVYTHKFSDKFRYTLDIGAGWEDNIPGIAGTSWSWAVNYLTYDFTDKLSGTTRFEFFNDAEGFRTGFEGSYWATTVGVTLKPCNSVWVRPELRYDYNSESRPFDGNHGQFSAAADLIIKW